MNLSHENEFEDLSSSHNFRTEIPNIIFQMKLEPLALAVYCILKMTAGDNGSCFKKNATICEEVGISIPTLARLKEVLEKNNLIKVIKRRHENGSLMPDLIQIIDIWPQNMQNYLDKYSKKTNSNFNRGCKGDLQGVAKMLSNPCKGDLHKQEHIEQEKEQQQAAPPAAAFSQSKKQEQQQSSKVHECLKLVDIPLVDKCQISARYDEETTRNAIAWATHPETKINKGLAPAIKWACQHKPEIPKNEQEEEIKNKSYAMKYEGKKAGEIFISTCSKYVEIVYGACQKEPLVLCYNAKDFMEQFKNVLNKYNFQLLSNT